MNLVDRSDNQVGDVSGFAPPGDIHRVHDTGETDRDLDPRLRHGRTRVGSSARRSYD